jgi:hypothetical protein
MPTATTIEASRGWPETLAFALEAEKLGDRLTTLGRALDLVRQEPMSAR